MEGCGQAAGTFSRRPVRGRARQLRLYRFHQTRPASLATQVLRQQPFAPQEESAFLSAASRERRPCQSWPMWARPTIRTRTAPARAATSRVTTIGTCPDAEEELDSDRPWFWARSRPRRCRAPWRRTEWPSPRLLILVGRRPEAPRERPGLFVRDVDSVVDVTESNYPVPELPNGPSCSLGRRVHPLVHLGGYIQPMHWTKAERLHQATGMLRGEGT